jgi:hypothetical protein
MKNDFPKFMVKFEFFEIEKKMLFSFSYKQKNQNITKNLIEF